MEDIRGDIGPHRGRGARGSKRLKAREVAGDVLGRTEVTQIGAVTIAGKYVRVHMKHTSTLEKKLKKLKR